MNPEFVYFVISLAVFPLHRRQLAVARFKLVEVKTSLSVKMKSAKWLTRELYLCHWYMSEEEKKTLQHSKNFLTRSFDKVFPTMETLLLARLNYKFFDTIFHWMIKSKKSCENSEEVNEEKLLSAHFLSPLEVIAANSVLFLPRKYSKSVINIWRCFSVTSRKYFSRTGKFLRAHKFSVASMFFSPPS